MAPYDFSAFGSIADIGGGQGHQLHTRRSVAWRSEERRDCLVPEDGKPSRTFFVDMIMMAELTGKERTLAEFKEMLARTGFRLDRVIDAGFNTFILGSSAI